MHSEVSGCPSVYIGFHGGHVGLASILTRLNTCPLLVFQRTQKTERREDHHIHTENSSEAAEAQDKRDREEEEKVMLVIHTGTYLSIGTKHTLIEHYICCFI